MKKQVILFLTFIILILILVSCTVSYSYSHFYDSATSIVYIDAGHGGFDGGCTSKDKLTLEKDITLKVTDYLTTYFINSGFIVYNTRLTDKALSDTKKEDIYKRVDLINKSKADIYLSIHANSFPSASVRGAQTFYSDTLSENKNLAILIQEYLKYIDVNNNRLAKKIEGKYLLEHVSKVGCIVEVGFLTNYEELNMLKNDSYLKEVAMMIYMASLEYLNTEKEVL